LALHCDIIVKEQAVHTRTPNSNGDAMSSRAKVLADRIARGAENIAAYAEKLTDAQWATTIAPDGRKAGVLVHHVGSVYPLEVDIARKLAAGEAIVGVTWAVIKDMNAQHARENAGVGKQEAIDLVRKNGKAAAEAIAQFTDEMLDNGGTVSLYGDAPLTCQFWIEDHPLRHSWHHVAKIRAVLG
jgi:hypothetical protein